MNRNLECSRVFLLDGAYVRDPNSYSLKNTLEVDDKGSSLKTNNVSKPTLFFCSRVTLQDDGIQRNPSLPE